MIPKLHLPVLLELNLRPQLVLLLPHLLPHPLLNVLGGSDEGLCEGYGGLFQFGGGVGVELCGEAGVFLRLLGCVA